MKSLFYGVLLIVLVGIGGLVYRNAIEHASRPIACPVDALVCPDGTAVGRTGLSCTFPSCPPPNISLTDSGISFAVPAGFTEAEFPDATTIAAYIRTASTSSDTDARILIRQYAIAASSTALATIQQTAISEPSGLPASVTSFTSSILGSYRFTIVPIEQNAGVFTTAYYLSRSTDVLRFDAVDVGVSNWMDKTLDKSALPAHAALSKLLSTLQGK